MSQITIPTIYQIARSDGTFLVNIPELQINTTATSLKLLGRRVIHYGDLVAANFVHLLENFSNTTPPSPALIGQLWFNKTTQTLSVFSATGWTPMGLPVYVQILAPSAANVGSFWFQSDDSVLRIWNGSSWIIVGGNLAVAAAGVIAPTAPNIGTFWYNPTTDQLTIWNGGNFAVMGPQIYTHVSVSPPSNPAVGAMWYNTGAKLLLVWSGITWINASATAVSNSPPATPLVGQLWFNTIAKQLYLWDGSTWVLIGPLLGGAIVSTSVPNNPTPGMIWYSSSDGTLQIYNGNQFINFGPAQGTPAGTPPFIGALLMISNDQNIATGATTVLSFDTASYDAGGFFSFGPSAIVPAGVVRLRVRARVTFKPDNVGLRRAVIARNNSALYDGAASASSINLGTTEAVILNLETATLQVSPGEIFTLQVFHDAAASLSVAGGLTWLSLERV